MRNRPALSASAQSSAERRLEGLARQSNSPAAAEFPDGEPRLDGGARPNRTRRHWASEKEAAAVIARVAPCRCNRAAGSRGKERRGPSRRGGHRNGRRSSQVCVPFRGFPRPTRRVRFGRRWRFFWPIRSNGPGFWRFLQKPPRPLDFKRTMKAAAPTNRKLTGSKAAARKGKHAPLAIAYNGETYSRTALAGLLATRARPRSFTCCGHTMMTRRRSSPF